MPRVLLALVVLCLHMPGVHADTSSAYGPAVDAACQNFNGTTPYADQGCALCHNTANYGQRIDPQWTWWRSGQLTSFCPQQTNQAPNGIIDSPVASQTITVGDSVIFAGTGTDPDGNTPLGYEWSFGGGAPDSSLQDPGSVRFDTAGRYTVTFTVTDSLNQSDPTPDTVIITVNEPVACTDGDGDGFSIGDANACGPLDCDDTDAAINPAATEQCSDGIDNNCNGLVDAADPDAVDCPVGDACLDNDNDRFSPEGGVCGPIDCDDFAAGINPGAAETCNDGVDNDCDGAADASDPECNGSDCIAAILGDGSGGQVNIVTAMWDGARRTLRVAGEAAPAGELVSVSDTSGVLLGTTTVRKNGNWNLRTRLQPADVPCRVRVEIGGQAAERDVTSAPADCGSAGGGDGFTIASAAWQNGNRRLTVEGAGVEARALVSIRNATGGALLGTTTGRNDGSWRFTTRLGRESVPCRVRAETGNAFDEQDVASAPGSCGGGDDGGDDDDSEPGDGDDSTPDDDSQPDDGDDSTPDDDGTDSEHDGESDSNETPDD